MIFGKLFRLHSSWHDMLMIHWLLQQLKLYMNLKEFLVGILSTTKSRRSRNLGGSTDNKWFENILFTIWIRIARDSIAAKRTSSLLLRYTNIGQDQPPVPTPRVRKVRDIYSNIHTRSTTSFGIFTWTNFTGGESINEMRQSVYGEFVEFLQSMHKLQPCRNKVSIRRR